MRCQTYTSIFLGNFLKYSQSASVQRCIEHGTLGRLLTVAAAHHVSDTTLLPVRAAVLRLISNHLVLLSPSPHALQSVFLAILHSAAHLRAGPSAAQPDDAISDELNRALRVVLPLVAPSLANELLPSILLAVGTVPSASIEDGSFSITRLHSTLLWCLQCTTAAASVLVGGISASIFLLSSAPVYAYEVMACRTAMMVSDSTICQAFVKLSTSAEVATSLNSSSTVAASQNVSSINLPSLPTTIFAPCKVETKRALEFLWALPSEALVANDARDEIAHLCLTCSALHAYAIAVWKTKSEHLAPPASSIAAKLLVQIRTTGELELAHDMPGEVGADPVRLSLLVDTALILVHYLNCRHFENELSLYLAPIVKLAVQCLRKHCKGELAINKSSCKRSSTQIPSSLMTLQDEPLKIAQLRYWNILAHVLARPLWERCLQLICVAGVALVESKDSAKDEARRAVIGSFVTLMADATPETSVAIVLQFPVLVQTLLSSSAVYSTESYAAATRPDASSALWLKPFFTWALPELRNGAITSRQPCIAFAVGLIARLCCIPDFWKLTVGTCPRPVLHQLPELIMSFGGLETGRRLSAGTGEASRWKPFNIFWQQVTPSVHATTEATKADLVRALAAVLRHATRQQLEAPAPKLSDAVQIHWSLMLESTTSSFLRATLAHEASVLFTSGSKVLSLLENGACAATQGSPVVETGALTQGGFLHQLGENFSQTAGTSTCGNVANEAVSGQGFLIVALGALASSIDFSAMSTAEGRKLLLWSVTRLVDIWSAPDVPIQHRLDAYHQLEGFSSSAMHHLDKVCEISIYI